MLHWYEQFLRGRTVGLRLVTLRVGLVCLSHVGLTRLNISLFSFFSLFCCEFRCKYWCSCFPEILLSKMTCRVGHYTLFCSASLSHLSAIRILSLDRRLLRDVTNICVNYSHCAAVWHLSAVNIAEQHWSDTTRRRWIWRVPTFPSESCGAQCQVCEQFLSHSVMLTLLKVKNI